MHTRTVNYVDVTHSNGCKKIKIKWWRVEQSRAERYTDICVLCTHSVRNNNISRPSLASVMMYQTQLPDAIWEQERIHTHILPCYTHVITSKWKCVQHVQSKPKCIHGHSGLCKACNSPFLIIPIHFFLLCCCAGVLLIKLIGNRMPYLKIVLYSMQGNTWANWIAKIQLDLYWSKLHAHAYICTHTHTHIKIDNKISR